MYADDAGDAGEDGGGGVRELALVLDTELAPWSAPWLVQLWVCE